MVHALPGRQVTLRAPFVNNRIDPAVYSKVALAIVNYKGTKPFPTTNDPCGEITYGTLAFLAARAAAQVGQRKTE